MHSIHNFKNFVWNSSVEVDAITQSSINRLANTLLEPLHCAFAEMLKPHRFVIINNSMQYEPIEQNRNHWYVAAGCIAFIPATIGALFLKTLCFIFDKEFRNNFYKIEQYIEQEKNLKILLEREPQNLDPFDPAARDAIGKFLNFYSSFHTSLMNQMTSGAKFLERVRGLQDSLKFVTTYEKYQKSIDSLQKQVNNTQLNLTQLTALKKKSTELINEGQELGKQNSQKIEPLLTQLATLKQTIEEREQKLLFLQQDEAIAELQSGVNKLCENIGKNDIKQKIEAITLKLEELGKATQELRKDFYFVRVMPLKRLLKELKYINTYLDFKSQYIKSNNDNDDVFKYESKIQCPGNCIINDSLNLRAEHVMLAVEEIQKLAVKMEKNQKTLLESQGNLKKNCGNESLKEFISKELQWMDQSVEACNSKVALAKAKVQKLEGPYQEAELILLFCKLSRAEDQLNNLLSTIDRDIKILLVNQNVDPEDAVRRCEQILDEILNINANIVNPLMAKIKSRAGNEGMTAFMGERVKKIEHIEIKVSFLKMWGELESRRNLMSQQLMKGEHCLEEITTFMRDLIVYRLKIESMKKQLGFWDKFLNLFSSKKEVDPNEDLKKLGEKLTKLVGEVQTQAEEMSKQQEPAFNNENQNALSSHWKALGLKEMPKSEEEVNAGFKAMAMLFHPNFYERKKETLGKEYGIKTVEEARKRWDRMCEAKEALLTHFSKFPRN